MNTMRIRLSFLCILLLVPGFLSQAEEMNHVQELLNQIWREGETELPPKIKRAWANISIPRLQKSA